LVTGVSDFAVSSTTFFGSFSTSSFFFDGFFASSIGLTGSEGLGGDAILGSASTEFDLATGTLGDD
jgi:hypothetical protein